VISSVVSLGGYSGEPPRVCVLEAPRPHWGQRFGSRHPTVWVHCPGSSSTSAWVVSDRVVLFDAVPCSIHVPCLVSDPW